MRFADFNYYLPKELIAHHPIKDRDRSRLLVLNRAGGIEHRYFYELIEYLNPEDTLVLNDTKVIPARLIGTNEENKTQVEFLLFYPGRKKTPKNISPNKFDLSNGVYTDLYKNEGNIWETLAKPAKKAKKGSRWSFDQGVTAEVIEVLDEGSRLLRFEFEGDFFKVLERIGQTPLPPYIKREAENSDKERYQTIYANSPGACAAPTAGLHFTKKLLEEIASRGIKTARITLHVGPGTFLPVRTERIEDHRMWSEYYEIGSETAEIINKTQGRIVAVGTTTIRALESAGGKAKKGWTDLFIYPGFKFKVVDVLITNFHLPKSTLLMLVVAFAGREKILAAYEEAIKEGYRFYSYGDAMLIL